MRAATTATGRRHCACSARMRGEQYY